ncbi:diguanylate cyclase [Nodosilinea nodulosa]|uniref:diguanylate cyclase n=1 Tax=Nodosilinea nodulosa TaxID=416001 RepID=UPI0002FA8A95|nr:diguanylate cyclase [Nodosilinea nodulosa]
MPPLSYQVATWLSTGEDYLAQGNYAQALTAFEHALSLAQRNRNPQGEILALQRLGYTHLEQGQPALSVSSIQQAIAIALEQHNLNDLYDCHRQLAQTYKSVHSFELALQHLEAAEGCRDSLPVAKLPEPESYIPDGLKAVDLSPGHGEWFDQNSPASLRLFRSIVDQANVGVAVFQADQLVYGNPRLMEWIGYSCKDLKKLSLAELIAPLPGQGPLALDPVPSSPRAVRLLGKAGQTIDVEIYAAALDFSDGQSLALGHRPALVTFLHDITAARQIAAQLKTSESRYHSLIQHVPIGLCRFNTEGRPLNANPALLNLFGFDSVAGFLQASPIQPSSLVVSRDRLLPWRDYLDQTGALKDCEIKLSRSGGRELWIRVVARAIADAAGTIQYYEAAVEDITEIKAAQTALEELAMRDSLTHVYNRRRFIELASQELTRAIRFNRPVTLLMLDIDHFKTVNDTCGHLAGDTVLRDIALRLKTNLRQSDILARYGGEEFILLMPETDQAQAWIGAERLRRVIADAPFDSGSGLLSVTASVGLSCWSASLDSGPVPSISPIPHINDLIGKADQALYRAKHSGRNQTQAEAWLHTVGSPTV